MHLVGSVAITLALRQHYRKGPAKWIFVSMAAHTEIGPLAPTPAAARENTQRTMGALFTRLVADTCANEMRGAVKAHGPEGVKSAFEYLGKMAMQELMSNPRVTASFGGFERFILSSQNCPDNQS